MSDKPEDDEVVIANTVAEISMILILLFFLAIAATTSKNIVTQDAIEIPKFSDDVLSSLKKKGCDHELKNDGRTLAATLITKEMTIFRGKTEQITEFGKGCFIPICKEIIKLTLNPNFKNATISIDGHASSEYRDYCGSETSPKISCRICGDKFDCNLRLSMLRSLEVFRFCRNNLNGGTFNNYIQSISGNDRNWWDIAKKSFEQKVRANGKSSAEVIKDKSGQEDETKSRRVEFTFSAQ